MSLDRAVAEGASVRPKLWDPLLQILSERGSVHERDCVEHLKTAGLDVIRIDGTDVSDGAVTETPASMQRGAAAIRPGRAIAPRHQGWDGRADNLRRVKVPSPIGGWS